jgi:hypothetical protein
MKQGTIQGFCDFCKTEGDYNDMKAYRWFEDDLYGFCSRHCAVRFANRETEYRKMISEWTKSN